MRLGLGLGLVRLGKAIASFVRDGLKLYYPFKDNSPDFLLDGSTSFDGTDDYISMGNVMPFSSGGFSFGCWVMPKDSGNGSQMVISKNNNTDGYRFQITNSTKTVQAIIEKDNNHASVTVTSTTALQNEEWYHVLITYDGATSSGVTKLYINGQLEATNSSGTGCDDSGGDLQIGRHLTSNYYNGLVSNAGFWSRELSASEVESIYWRGSHSELKDTELTNLISWYNLSSAGLGAEVISNGTMEAVSTNTLLPNYESFPEDWTSAYGTLSIHERSSTQAFAGTHSLLFKTNASSRSGVAQAFTVTGSVSYRLEFYVYGVTGNTIQITHQTGTGTASTLDGGGTLLDYEQGVRIGEWDKITLDFTTSGSGTVTGTVLQLGSNVSGNSYYIDNVSLKRIGAGAPDSQGSNDGTIEGATTNSDSYSGESPFKPRIQDKATPKMAVQLADGSTSFDGADDHIQISDNSTIQNIFASGGTLSLWLKTNSDGENTVGRIADKANWFFCTTGESAGVCDLRFLSVTSGGNGDWITTNTCVPNNEWTHVSLVYNGSSTSNNPTIYVNGSSQAITETTTPATTQTSDVGNDLYIGNRADGIACFDGEMANYSIHSSELTQSQVQELMFTERYQNLSADLKTNLVSWYDLGSTSLGSELVDEDARTFDGTGTHSWGIYGSNTVSNVDNNLVVTYVSDDRGAKLVLSDANDLNTDLTAGITYQVTMNVKINTGDALIRVYNGSSYETIGTVDSTSFTDVTGTFTAQVGSVTLNFDNMGSGEVITVNEFSIKEVQAPDSEGTNEGSIYGATTNTGYTHSPHGVVDPLNFGEVYSGRALSFDGNNDSVSIPDDNSLDISGDWSISVWIKIDSGMTSYHRIIGKQDPSSNQCNYGIGIAPTNKVGAIFNDGSWRTAYSTNSLTVGKWHHIVGIWDNSEENLYTYIDGSLATTANASGGSPSGNDDPITIGMHESTGGEYFAGDMSGIKLLNTALTQDQVRELYTKPEIVLPTGVSASNLKLDLPMQEGSGSYVYDGSGNQNHGTIVGATFVSGEEYGYQASLVRSNTPMVFDGSNDTVNIPDSSLWNMPKTVSMWFNCSSITANGISNFEKDTLMGYDTIYWGIQLDSTNNKIQYYYFDGAQRYWSTDSSISLNTWHHLVVVSTSSDSTIYLDGSSIGTNSLTWLNNNVPSPQQLRFGSYGATTNVYRPFNGLINDVAIWDVALDANAVSALYNSGVPLLPTSDSGNYDNSSSLVGYWRNDGNTTWTDRSTNSNNGTASGSPVEILIPEGSTEGRDNQGYYLSDTTTISNGIRLHGSGEYIEIQDSEVLSFGDSVDDRPFTIEFWLKVESGASRPLYIWKGVANRANVEYWIDISSSQVTFQLGDVTGHSNRIGRYQNLDVRDGNWHHYAFTYNGSSASSGMKIYQDTTRIDNFADDAGSYTAMHNDTRPLVIGKKGDDGTLYNDSIIDEFRIYHKELSTSEITKNYNNGKSSHQ